jgi:hypothetical protein
LDDFTVQVLSGTLCVIDEKQKYAWEIVSPHKRIVFNDIPGYKCYSAILTEKAKWIILEADQVI